MARSDIGRLIEEYHRALGAFINGDPAPVKRLFSRGADVTLANPFGPPARGWDQVEPTLDRAVSQFREGEIVGFDRISDFETPDLAFTVEIERVRARLEGWNEMAPVSLRVTTVCRREGDEWKILHRHADPITAPRPPESILEG